MKYLIVIPLLLIGATRGAPQDDGAVLPETLKPGLVGKYWHLTHVLKKFPVEVLGQSPQQLRVDGFINFDQAEGRGFRDLPWSEYVAIEWSGILRLPETAEYTFYLKSMDGSKLYLDGALVIDHDGRHSLKATGSKTLSMTAGDHDIRIEYFQNAMARCVLCWTHGKVEKQAVPATAFWHRYDKEADRGAD